MPIPLCATGTSSRWRHPFLSVTVWECPHNVDNAIRSLGDVEALDDSHNDVWSDGEESESYRVE